MTLSNVERTHLHFSEGDTEIDRELNRADFESWIQEELREIEDHVHGLLSKTGAHPADVDVVFLTGGSSFVPAVRRIFESRFGHHKSVPAASSLPLPGLALRAVELH